MQRLAPDHSGGRALLDRLRNTETAGDLGLGRRKLVRRERDRFLDQR